MKSKYKSSATLVFCILFTCALLFPAKRSYSQDFNYKVNAMYIYYFAKYINLTGQSSDKDLIIGILGDSPVDDQLRSVISNKKVYGKNIIVKKITLADITSCNMVVISKSQSALTKKVSDTVSNLPILIIAEKQGYAKNGAQICIYVDDEDDFKTKFELSKGNIEKSKLKVSHELLALGEIVK